MRLLVVAAAAKIALGLVASLAIRWDSGLTPDALPSWYYVLLLLAFGASGILLNIGGRKDARARALGLVFLLFGTLFTDRLAARAIPALPIAVGGALRLCAAPQLVAFSAYAMWRFAWEFPRVQPALVPRWFPAAMSRVALWAAVVLLAGNYAMVLLPQRGSAMVALEGWISPTADAGFFWQIIAILDLVSLVLLARKLRSARAEERRRLVWLVTGIVIGTLPMVAHVLLVTVVPAYAAFAAPPDRSRTLGVLLTLFSLVIPAAAAYAVIVDQVLAVRFVMRQALQYALARYTVLGAMAGTLAVVVWAAYSNRGQPMRALVDGSPATAAAMVVLAALLAGRRPILSAIDRRFFREQYDARNILVRLVDSSQRAHTARELATLIPGEIERAFHLESATLLMRSAEGDRFRDPTGRVPDLDTACALVSLIAGDRSPLDVDRQVDSSALGRLPAGEREWLADTRARLVVPLFGVQNTLIGVLTLGDKRSELPFTREDRQLMTAVAASAALALEQHLNRESPDPDPTLLATSTPTAHAVQCTVCNRVQSRELTPRCHACGGPIQDALLPTVLSGKFEIERQIGAGGMGVVYRALDLSLRRPVAIKVLPRVGPQAASRLRREARAMAIMQHPNLAVIHALESWRGQPAIVLEYLAGGTLADRLRDGPLPVRDVVGMGVIIGDVLRHVHAAGFLHRDMKPSNIGFTGDGIPKLLDFGLVRLVADLNADSAVTDTVTMQVPVATTLKRAATDMADTRDTDSHSVRTRGSKFVGTPTYMSPEALAMEPPSESVDLWGLALSLYEALTGSNPFAGSTLADTAARVAGAVLPDPRDVRADCPQELAAFFAAALAADPRQRPRTAVEFVGQLRRAYDTAGWTSVATP